MRRVRFNDQISKDIEVSTTLAVVKAPCDEALKAETQQHLEEFSKLRCASVQEIWLKGPGIFSLEGLTSITEVHQDLKISKTQIRSLLGLHNIARVRGYILIVSNANLKATLQQMVGLGPGQHCPILQNRRFDEIPVGHGHWEALESNVATSCQLARILKIGNLAVASSHIKD